MHSNYFAAHSLREIRIIILRISESFVQIDIVVQFDAEISAKAVLDWTYGYFKKPNYTYPVTSTHFLAHQSREHTVEKYMFKIA